MPTPAPRIVIHVGLPKTGTTYLQGLLAGQRDRLLAGGVGYPLVRPGAMFHGAVEVRGSHAKFGLVAGEVAGTWAALCERARAFDGTTVLGHEVLAGATIAQIRAALAPLAGHEVHVVVTARDLGRQATAHWQEEVKLGATWSFAEFERDQLRADTGPDAGPDAGGARPHFWHAQDFADCLRRWGSAVGADRAHLVLGPPPGAPPEELWRRFAEAVGIDPALVDAAVPPANPSLGAAEVALLRAVNAELAGRLDPHTYNRVVKRGYAEGRLAGRPGPRPRTPHELAGLLTEATQRWVAQVAAAGHPVHGDLADLAPVTAPEGSAHPDDVALPEDPVAVAQVLLAEADKRTGSTSASGPHGGRWPRLIGRRRRG
ncbi:MAG: hypothetical protein HYU55_16445 [Nocardioides sp.]|nr:hypothetical protein [Nocardioides sp.]